MIVIISSQGPTLESSVERRFGRCEKFIQVDTDSSKWQVFDNPGASQSGGAGVAAAQFVIDQKADVIVSGDFGPNAANAFKSAGIKMRLFAEDTTSVQMAVEHLASNHLAEMS